MPERYLLVFLGGGAGSLLRFLAGAAVLHRFGSGFPLGTVLINISGSFLIGVLMTLLVERLPPHPDWHALLVVGFLGGYTTFSSFEYETYHLMRNGLPWLGLLNVTGSVVLGYLAVWVGALIAR